MHWTFFRSAAATAISHQVTITTTTEPASAPTTVEAPAPASNAAAHPTPSNIVVDPLTTEKSLLADVDSSPSHAATTASISAINSAPTFNTPDVVQPVFPVTDVKPTSDDVVMSDPPSAAQKPQNDENLPAWLVPMIKYLRGVATDIAWQNLVTEFVEFEKGCPPTGLSLLFPFPPKLKLTI